MRRLIRSTRQNDALIGGNIISQISVRHIRKRKFAVLSVLLFVLALGAAWLGVIVLTSAIQTANFIVCDSPADLRCTDNFFFGRKGGQNTLGTALVAVAVLSAFVSGSLTMLAARKPVIETTPPTFI